MGLGIAAGFAAAALSGAAVAGTASDDFEAYAPGTFPAANWVDAATVAPFGTLPPPSPSCTVGVTNDAFGQPTRALHLDGSWVGSASGIYRSVTPGPGYTLTMDVRTDAFGEGATDNPSDWPWMIGLSRYDAAEQAGGWRSLQMYGTDMSHDFRAYAISAAGSEDFTLGATIAAGVWYRVRLDIDADAGSIRNRIWDSATSNLLLDATIHATGWLPSDNAFDTVTINQGEFSATTSADVWVDNVSIVRVPEPAAAALLVAGRGLLRRR
jgi:hypothetical protein